MIMLGFMAGIIPLLWGQKSTEEPPLSKGMSVSLHAGTAGSGIAFAYLKGEAPQKLQFGLRVFGVRDSREIKVESAFAERGSKFVYGKVKRFFVATPFIGIIREIVPSNQNNVVSLAFSGQIGPALGFTRPYYLDIEEQSTLGLVPPEPTAYDPDQHAYDNIVGVSSLVESRWDLEFVPGVSSRVAMIVDISRKKKRITALELGLNADYFFKEVPIMAFIQNRQFFLAATLGFTFGSQWGDGNGNEN